jgi:hypothetical protein
VLRDVGEEIGISPRHGDVVQRAYAPRCVDAHGHQKAAGGAPQLIGSVPTSFGPALPLLCEGAYSRIARSRRAVLTLRRWGRPVCGSAYCPLGVMTYKTQSEHN